jgi:ubiquinone/menaquinone biosynthesis C-methylase UbiE
MKLFDRLKMAISIIIWGNSYRRAWEIIGRKRDSALPMIDNSKNEEEISKSGQEVAERMQKAMNIQEKTRVLDIGCGVGRVGKYLAPHCAEWVGVDISKGLLRIARERMKDVHNAKLTHIENANLKIFPDNSFDAIYAHIVLLHLDKEDMWEYLLETKRVLKPYGVFYFDTFNLMDEWGFKRFEWEIDIYRRKDRPLHRGHWSTPEEIRRYLAKAGLKILYLHDSSYLIQAFTTKGDGSPEEADRIAELRESLKNTQLMVPLGDARWWEPEPHA